MQWLREGLLGLCGVTGGKLASFSGAEKLKRRIKKKKIAFSI